MADNLAWTPGAGATIAADEIAGAHYQRVKLSMGADGSAVDAPGTAANGLYVDVRQHPFLIDAFQRVAVAAPVTLFDSQFQYDLQPLLWEQSTATGGSIAHQPNSCAARLSTGTGVGSKALIQTRSYFRYQPGKAQQVFMTFVMGAAVANVRRRVGYFDADDGIYLEQNGTTDVAIVRRTKQSGSVVENRVGQASWNVSTLGTLDLSKAQILVIDLQFLGVGRVRVGFDIDGIVYWAHQFLNANSLANVYMRTANLPLRYEQEVITGTATASTMDCICSTVIASGGFEDERGYPFAVGNTADIALTTSQTHVISIRPATTFNSITNRTTIIVDDIEILGGANPVYWELLYGSTFTGGSWAAANSSSAIEFSVNTALNVAGTVLDAGFVASSGASARQSSDRRIGARLPLTLDIAGANPIALTLACRSTTGTPNVRAAMSWKELR